MAATSFGVSAFHEPAPSPGWSDPLWLAGAAAVGALGVRSAIALGRRSAEAAFWAWAAASFLPVSQLFPFLYPMADRYLYFILPGLIGGALLALGAGAPSAAARNEEDRRWLARAGIAAGLALAVLFAARSPARAAIWASPRALLGDSAAHYPAGRTAHLLRALRAAQLGDSDAAIAELRSALALGFNRYEQLQGDPAFDRIRDDPRFRSLVREMAGWWVERLSATPDPTQIELRTLALAHLARGERQAAIDALERAVRRGGPLDARLRDELAQVRASPP
jgi:tetratricopeptide (TPR) repeat protein